MGGFPSVWRPVFGRFGASSSAPVAPGQPIDRQPLVVLDPDGDVVGFVLAAVRWTQRLTGAYQLEQITIPKDQLLSSGATISKLAYIDSGWYLQWDGYRYIVESADGDLETGITVKAVDAATELANFYCSYSPGPATYLNQLPSTIGAAILSGKCGRAVRNPGFGILDSSDLPTNWSHPTGWTSQLVSNRRVWQADAGSDESYSDDRPCTPGISYQVVLDMSAASATGTRGVMVRWIKADGSTVDSAATNLATEDGSFHTVDTGPIVALGTRMRIVLVTSGTDAVTQFDDVRLYEIGPDTGWTYTGAMDTRLAAIPFGDGAITKYGVWAEGGGPPTTYLASTAVGDYIARVVSGPFVTIGFAAGGAGAQAKIRINGVQYEASGTSLVRGTDPVDVSAAVSLTCAGLDPTNDHIVEIEVAAVTVRFTGLTVSTDNLISMRWDVTTTVYQALASLQKAVGGEMHFDTVNRVVHHVAARGQDLKSNNVVEFRRGKNITKMGRTKDRTKIVNRLTGLGYGEGEYQLVVTVDATGTDPVTGLTSIETYGVRRGTYTDKDCKSLAAMTKTLLRLVEESCWESVSYKVEVLDSTAALCEPGDTGHFVYGDANVTLRILEISRSNDGGAATLAVGSLKTELADLIVPSARDLATLQRSFQGVPADTNDSFSEQFERTSGGVDVPAEIGFFIPYGADLIDLRLRYQVGGMRSFAKAVGGGGGTNTASGGGSTSGAGGASSPTSSSGGSTLANTALSSGGVQRIAVDVTQSLTAMTGGPLDETDTTSPYTILNETGQNSAAGDPHIHGLHNHTHEMTHTHTYGIIQHWHDITAHTHTVTSHTHTVSLADHYHSTPNHQHTLPNHAHTLSYGIYTSSAPTTGVRVYLDSVLIAALNGQTIVSDFDLLAHVGRNSSGFVNEGWHTLKFQSATNGDTGSVRGCLFVSKFLSGTV